MTCIPSSLNQAFRDLLAEVCECGFDNRGIELRARASPDFGGGDVEPDRTVVGAFVHHCVDSIDDHEHACAKGDFGAPQSPWITGAIEFFMMGINDVRRTFEKFDVLQEFVSILRMPAHDLPLFRREPGGFAQNAAWNFQLSNSVQQGATFD